MLSDTTIQHMIRWRLETVPGVCGFLRGPEIEHRRDCVHVQMWLDIDNLELTLHSAFQLKPNPSRCEVLNEIDEIEAGIKQARLQHKWTRFVPKQSGWITLPGTGLRGRWDGTAGTGALNHPALSDG